MNFILLCGSILASSLTTLPIVENMIKFIETNKHIENIDFTPFIQDFPNRIRKAFAESRGIEELLALHSNFHKSLSPPYFNSKQRLLTHGDPTSFEYISEALKDLSAIIVNTPESFDYGSFDKVLTALTPRILNAEFQTLRFLLSADLYQTAVIHIANIVNQLMTLRADSFDQVMKDILAMVESDEWTDVEKVKNVKYRFNIFAPAELQRPLILDALNGVILRLEMVAEMQTGYELVNVGARRLMHFVTYTLENYASDQKNAKKRKWSDQMESPKPVQDLSKQKKRRGPKK